MSGSGAARAAAFGALAPVVSALGGWWWLADPLTPIDIVAVALAVAGVALASGAQRWPGSHADGDIGLGAKGKT